MMASKPFPAITSLDLTLLRGISGRGSRRYHF